MGNSTSIDELNQLELWLEAGKQAALATVVATWGSSPRTIGSHLVINETGAFMGSVSGGCIEGAVIAEALEVIEEGKPRLLSFGVSDEQAWQVGLSCGGKIEVYVEKVSPETLQQIQQDRKQKQAVAVITRLEDGEHCLVYPEKKSGKLALTDEQIKSTRELLSAARCGKLGAEQSLFVRSYLAPVRLVVVGAVHIAQALAPMARVAGFDVTVVDPRRAFCQAERFPGVSLCSDWPDDALQALDIDNQTAVVTLSHDPKIDDPALIIALTSPAFYIGSLGSRRTHAQRIERLTKEGLKDQLHRINAPVGLDLGGRAHAEIAVSILAQVIEARYKGSKP